MKHGVKVFYDLKLKCRLCRHNEHLHTLIQSRNSMILVNTNSKNLSANTNYNVDI